MCKSLILRYLHVKNPKELTETMNGYLRLSNITKPSWYSSGYTVKYNYQIHKGDASQKAFFCSLFHFLQRLPRLNDVAAPGQSLFSWKLSWICCTPSKRSRPGISSCFSDYRLELLSNVHSTQQEYDLMYETMHIRLRFCNILPLIQCIRNK